MSPFSIIEAMRQEDREQVRAIHLEEISSRHRTFDVA